MIKIMTEKQFERELDRTRNMMYDEFHRNNRFDNLERKIWELESRLARLENNGELPELTPVVTADCSWK